MQDTPTASDSDARHDLVYHAVFLFAAVMVIVVALALEVRDDRVVLPILDVPLPESCWFKRLTGADCPGCGLTRSVIALVHGEFSRAWRFNPGGYFVFALIVFQLPYRIGQFWRISRGFPSWRPTKATSFLVSLLATILFLQWAVRWWL